MAFVPLNFQDKIGPPIPAAWLNKLDTIQNAISANAAGNVVVAAPTSGIGLTISGGVVINTTASGAPLTINGNAAGGGGIPGGLLINLLGGVNNGIYLVGTFPTFMQPLIIRNLSASVTAINYAVECANDTPSCELFLFNTSTTYTGSVDTGVPAGPTCGIAAGNSQFVISVATTNNATNVTRVLINGVTGLVKLWEGTNNTGTAGLLQAATVESGSFTLTATAITGSPTGVCHWFRSGPMITLQVLTNITGTSTGTTFTLTGLPAALTPASAVRCPAMVIDNSIWADGTITIAGTTLSVVKGDNSPFTNGNTKGIANICLTYPLN